jgi:hypothetical protein
MMSGCTVGKGSGQLSVVSGQRGETRPKKKWNAILAFHFFLKISSRPVTKKSIKVRGPSPWPSGTAQTCGEPAQPIQAGRNRTRPECQARE